MNMILVGPDLKKRDFVAVADVHANPSQHGVDFVCEDGAAVLRWTNHVVQQHGHIMTFVDVFAHANTLYRLKRRPVKVHADKGYDSQALRDALQERGIGDRIARRRVDGSEKW